MRPEVMMAVALTIWSPLAAVGQTSAGAVRADAPSMAFLEFLGTMIEIDDEWVHPADMVDLPPEIDDETAPARAEDDVRATGDARAAVEGAP